MAAKFEVFKDKRGEYRFRLKAANGQIIATGEGYKAKAGCENGIDSVRKNAVADRFEVYEDKRGEYRFRLKAANSQVIATGEGYKSKSGCDNGIASIKKNAPGAKVVYLDD
jgi:uncharacterized protein